MILSKDYSLFQINDVTWDGLSNQLFNTSVEQLTPEQNITMAAFIKSGGTTEHRSTRGWGEWSAYKSDNYNLFMDQIKKDGFDSVVEKYNVNPEYSSAIKQQFQEADHNDALAVMLAESSGDPNALNINESDTISTGSFPDIGDHLPENEFASLLRQRYPSQYQSFPQSDEEIISHYLQKRPNDSIYLADNILSKYVNQNQDTAKSNAYNYQTDYSHKYRPGVKEYANQFFYLIFKIITFFT